MEELSEVYGEHDAGDISKFPDWVNKCLQYKGNVEPADGNELDGEWNKVIVMDPPSLVEIEQPLDIE